VRLIPKKNNFLLRLLSTLVLFPLVVFVLVKGGSYTDFLLALVTLLSLREWMQLSLQNNLQFLRKLAWFLLGNLYILFACYLFWKFTVTLQVYLLVLVCLMDVSAYIVGKSLKGPKLAFKISPNKTWAGAIGGIIFPILILSRVNVFAIEIEGQQVLYNIAAVTLLSIVAQSGDLLQSWSKRQFGVKDSGTLIPGHGGILDRLDSLFAVSVITGLILYSLGYINL
jgi:phosphatidate cytidylyltransferase